MSGEHGCTTALGHSCGSCHHCCQDPVEPPPPDPEAYSEEEQEMDEVLACDPYAGGSDRRTFNN